MANQEHIQAIFAPMLYLTNVADGIRYYQRAFGATELRRWSNDDGTVHVAEMSIGPAMFHLHEEVARKKELDPRTLGGTSVVIGLFVADPDQLAGDAVKAGGELISPVRDYEYNYRQGTIRDPFGHHWQLQKKIGSTQAS